MAMNLKALNIGIGKGKAEAKPAPKEKPAKKGAVSATTTFDGAKKGSPLLGKSFRTRMQALIIALGFLVFVIAAVGLLAIRTTTNGTAYVGAAGQMRMLSQRLAKESQQGLQGNSEAFGRLKRSRGGAACWPRVAKRGVVADVAAETLGVPRVGKAPLFF